MNGSEWVGVPISENLLRRLEADPALLAEVRRAVWRNFWEAWETRIDAEFGSSREEGRP